MMADMDDIQTVILELQRGQEQMRETVNMIAMAIPSFRVEGEAPNPTASDIDEDEDDAGDVNDRATLEAARRIDPSTNYTMADAQHAARMGCRVCDTKRGRDYNKAAKVGSARCRLPVKSQFCAWFAMNIDEVEQFDFQPPTMLEIVIGIAELQGCNINFARQENDWLAMRWLDHAWKYLPRTKRVIDDEFPF